MLVLKSVTDLMCPQVIQDLHCLCPLRRLPVRAAAATIHAGRQASCSVPLTLAEEEHTLPADACTWPFGYATTSGLVVGSVVVYAAEDHRDPCPPECTKIK